MAFTKDSLMSIGISSASGARMNFGSADETKNDNVPAALYMKSKRRLELIFIEHVLTNLIVKICSFETFLI